MFKTRCLVSLLAGIAFIAGSTALAKGPAISDAQIKENIIKESIAEYPGICACPFNRARNGSSCGKRSAWSKAGGYSPICYKDEVTKEMIKAWRESR